MGTAKRRLGVAEPIRAGRHGGRPRPSDEKDSGDDVGWNPDGEVHRASGVGWEPTYQRRY